MRQGVRRMCFRSGFACNEFDREPWHHHRFDAPIHIFAASTPGPTFEDLTFDDNLADIDRIVQYSCSSIAL